MVRKDLITTSFVFTLDEATIPYGSNFFAKEMTRHLREFTHSASKHPFIVTCTHAGYVFFKSICHECTLKVGDLMCDDHYSDGLNYWNADPAEMAAHVNEVDINYNTKVVEYSDDEWMPLAERKKRMKANGWKSVWVPD